MVSSPPSPSRTAEYNTQASALLFPSPLSPSVTELRPLPRSLIGWLRIGGDPKPRALSLMHPVQLYRLGQMLLDSGIKSIQWLRPNIQQH